MARREGNLRVESAVDAERFIQDVGFANTLTDARRVGPRCTSRYAAAMLVCPAAIRRKKNDEENRRSEIRGQTAESRRQKAEG
jgi:hypothetical protein